MRRIAERTLSGLFLGLAVVWGLDLGIWLVRGRTMGTVQVTWFSEADLKGGKTEYYPDGSGPVRCSQSVFPRGGVDPCWYVARNPVIFEH